MKVIHRRNVGFVAFVGVLLAFGGTAQAALSFIEVRANLGSNDSVDWGVLGEPFTVVSNPFTIVSTGGLGMTVSKTASGDFERRNQNDGWFGNFAPGDRLIWTRNTVGPMSILFDTPVMGAGAQIQPDKYGNFTGSIAAYDSTNNLLGSFSKAGVSNAQGNNTAIFLGVLSDSVNIARITFDVDNGTEDFAINQMDLKKGQPVGPVIPEASSYALFALGLLGMIAWRRREKTR